MNIFLLGTGLMGAPMAERILGAGYPLTVYNRTFQKVKPLQEKGAEVAKTPYEAIVHADCVILMLADSEAIEQVIFSNEVRVLSAKTFIQMGTISPEESMKFSHRIQSLGGEYLESPVLGSRKEAADGELILMVGAAKEQFEHWRNFLKVFGPNPRWIGEVGKAASLKLALNHLIASHAVGFCLSLAYIQKSGVRVEDFMDVLKGSFLFAPMFERKLPKWLTRDFTNPNFPVKHLLKDVGLILGEAKNKKLKTDVLEVIHQLLMKAEKKGLGDCDYSAVYEVIRSRD